MVPEKVHTLRFNGKPLLQAQFSIAQKKSVGVPWISFLLSVKYVQLVHFI